MSAPPPVYQAFPWAFQIVLWLFSLYPNVLLQLSLYCLQNGWIHQLLECSTCCHSCPVSNANLAKQHPPNSWLLWFSKGLTRRYNHLSISIGGWFPDPHRYQNLHMLTLPAVGAQYPQVPHPTVQPSLCDSSCTCHDSTPRHCKAQPESSAPREDAVPSHTSVPVHTPSFLSFSWPCIQLKSHIPHEAFHNEPKKWDCSFPHSSGYFIHFPTFI